MKIKPNTASLGALGDCLKPKRVLIFGAGGSSLDRKASLRVLILTASSQP